MFKRVVNLVEILALIAAGVFVVLLFTNDSGAENAAAYPGATLFAANCARCHGSDGEGGLGPQLSGGEVAKNLTEPEEVTVVTRGRGGMPAFGGDLTPEEIKQVVAYTRTL